MVSAALMVGAVAAAVVVARAQVKTVVSSFVSIPARAVVAVAVVAAAVVASVVTVAVVAVLPLGPLSYAVRSDLIPSIFQ